MGQNRGQGPEKPGKAGKPPKSASKAGYSVIKTERLPDGRVKRILKDMATGQVVEKID